MTDAITASPTPSLTACAGTKSPSRQHDACAAGLRAASLMVRVSRVLQDLSSARSLSDEEIRQHSADCSLLMEQAYARFQQFHNPADRDDAVLWMHRRDEANRSLSPAWKAAREAQIQQDIANGAGFFVEAGDAARARIERTST